jgi:hypothetical protein
MINSSYRHIAAIENASMAQLFVATAKAIVIFSDRRQHGFQAMDFAFAVPFCLYTRPGNQCLQVAISLFPKLKKGIQEPQLEVWKMGPSTFEKLAFCLLRYLGRQMAPSNFSFFLF